MSAQGRGLPWSRGRGFRPQGPFQPARRPGEPAGTGAGDSKPAQTNSSHGNSNQGYNKPSNSYQSTNSNQGNNGYVSNKETGHSHNSSQRQSNMTNGYQDSRNQSGNQGNGYQSGQQTGNQGNSSQSNRNQGGNQGNSATRDIRFAGNQQQHNSGNSGGGAKQVQYKQNGTGDRSTAKNDDTRLLAKYTYKANPNSPLGEPEISLSQGQNVSLITKHASNDQWWKVRADNGGEGYVPATYVMILEAKTTSLPWLAGKKAEEEELPEAKPVFKPYKSAYDKDAQAKKEPEVKKPNLDWFCRTCDKQLNGPKPYGAHMASKMHKEEVDLAKEQGTYVEDY